MEEGEFIKSDFGSDEYEKVVTAWFSEDKGIKAVYGEIKDKEWEIQSYLFSKESGWTSEKAEEWVKDNHENPGWVSLEVGLKEYSLEDIKDVGGVPTGEMEIRGIAVSTDISNEHRFPAEILKTNQTLGGQPLIEQHSYYPWEVLWSDMYGKIEGLKSVDAGVYDKDEDGKDHVLKGKPNVELHFKGRLWNDQMIKVVKEFPERIKFSVGFKHSFYLEEYPAKWTDNDGKDHEYVRYVSVSKKVEFDHLGIVTRPADGRAILKSEKKEEKAKYDETPIVNGEIGDSDCFLDDGGINVDDEAIKILQEKLTELNDGKKVFETELAELKQGKEDLGEALKTATEKIKEVSGERDGYASELSEIREEARFGELEAYVDDCISKGLYTPVQKENIIKQYSGFTPDQFELQKTIDEAATPLVHIGEVGLFSESKKDKETTIVT